VPWAARQPIAAFFRAGCRRPRQGLYAKRLSPTLAHPAEPRAWGLGFFALLRMQAHTTSPCLRPVWLTAVANSSSAAPIAYGAGFRSPQRHSLAQMPLSAVASATAGTGPMPNQLMPPHRGLAGRKSKRSLVEPQPIAHGLLGAKSPATTASKQEPECRNSRLSWSCSTGQGGLQGRQNCCRWHLEAARRHRHRRAAALALCSWRRLLQAAPPARSHFGISTCLAPVPAQPKPASRHHHSFSSPLAPARASLPLFVVMPLVRCFFGFFQILRTFPMHVRALFSF